MPQTPAPQVIVAGGGPAALLAALELHLRGVTVALVDAALESPPPPHNPELAQMWGDESLPGLFHQSLNAWKALPQKLSLPLMVEEAEALDLATSPGRETKLREEALLDALGGEEITFTATVPPCLAASRVRGVKRWPKAPLLTHGLLLTLRDAVAARGIPVLASPAAALQVFEGGSPQLTLADGAIHQPAHLVIASAATARRLLPAAGLALPLRPARGHCLTLPLPPGSSLPAITCRLMRGHMFLLPMANQMLQLHYDALLDPLQATLATAPDEKLAAALLQYAATLVPALAGAVPTQVETATHWLTPDFLPALGAWPGQPGLLLAVGWCGRENAFAAAAASQLAQAIAAPDEPVPFSVDFAPNRFAGGHWKKTERPGTLTWAEPGAAPVNLLTTAPEYMSNVQTIARAEAQYAGNVVQTEKTVITADKKLPELRQRPGKPKIQTAGLSKK